MSFPDCSFSVFCPIPELFRLSYLRRLSDLLGVTFGDSRRTYPAFICNPAAPSKCGGRVDGDSRRAASPASLKFTEAS